MAKAFDAVPHQRLLYKLHWYGIQGKVHKWISEFLKNHSQKVMLDGTYSSSVACSHFCSPTGNCARAPAVSYNYTYMYINDLTDCTCINHSTTRLFADDYTGAKSRGCQAIARGHQCYSGVGIYEV